MQEGQSGEHAGLVEGGEEVHLLLHAKEQTATLEGFVS